MAIFFSNKSSCILCGKIIHSEKEVIGFPAFIPKFHSLHKFSDEVFHNDCYQEWKHRDKFNSLYKEYVEIWESRPRNLESIKEIEDWGKEAFSKLFIET